MFLDYVGTDVPAGFGGSRLNSGRTSPAEPVLRTFVQYLTTFCSQPETAGDVISGAFWGLIVFDKWVKRHDPSLNHCPEIPPEAVGSGIFDSLFIITSDLR